MKQLSLFDEDQNNQTAPAFSIWKLYIDGASRNNPGPSGAGVCVLKDGQVVQTYAVFLGKKTNNEAEYLALLLALFKVQVLLSQDDLVLIVSDSQLLVRQIKGIYRVKEPRLQRLHAIAKHLLGNIQYDILHVLREDNKDADALANKGIDTKAAVPADFIQFLQHYAFSL